jgi:hypothetical protein
LPAGGADLSGVLIFILVGVASHCFRSACAVATFPFAAPDELDEAPALEEVEELEDPHAASAAEMTSAVASAKNRRAPRPLPLGLRTCKSWFMNILSF